MNQTITQEMVDETTSEQQGSLEAAVVATPTTPTLDSIVQAICLDAKRHSLKYLLRCDTGHDGE